MKEMESKISKSQSDKDNLEEKKDGSNKQRMSQDKYNRIAEEVNRIISMIIP